MEATLNYTVKKGDGYLSIARYIFSQSHRTYIRTLISRYDLMTKVAKIIEADLSQQYLNFQLKAGRSLKLHADPGYYIPGLSLQANHGSPATQAITKATTTVQNDNYFVLHSTEANLQDTALEKLKTDKKVGAGHAYINKAGTIFKIWPYNSKNGWATRVERTENKPELRGKLVNIELVYANNEEPTEEQYQALAEIYLETKTLFGKWLAIVAHREIDRGIKGGHKDPIGFKFDYFYSVLKTKNVPTDSINKQSQIRFNQLPWCEHKWEWPPVLTGTTFAKVTDSVFTAKGCK